MRALNKKFSDRKLVHTFENRLLCLESNYMLGVKISFTFGNLHDEKSWVLSKMLVLMKYAT